jgi:hypothetical protein
MAQITFFEENNASNSSCDIFADEYLELHPSENGTTHVVEEITLVKSNKGYMLITKLFKVFCWKNSSVAKLLVEALAIYVEQKYGYAVVVVLDKTAQNKYRLGIDGEMQTTWYGSGKKYSTMLDIPICDPLTSNPFLLAPQSPQPPTSRARTKASKEQDD